MHAATRLSPRITTMIRMDHAQVLATFHKYRLDAAPRKKAAIVETVCSAVEIHAQLEEEIFYPALRLHDARMIDKSLPAHGEMRRLIAELRAMAAAEPAYDTTFMELMRNIIHHVADEETTLLPQAEQVLAGRLEQLGWAMTRRRFELAGPRAGEMALRAARSHPGVVIAAAALLIGAVVTGRALMPTASSRSWPRPLRRLPALAG
jgi:hypothetical protein